MLWLTLAAVYLAPFVLVWPGVLSYGVDIAPDGRTDYAGSLLLTVIVLAPAVLLTWATLRHLRRRA